LFAAVPKIVIYSVFIKLFLLVFYTFNSFWSLFVLASSVLSIIIGSLSALYQKRLKRLFAYSTISHGGFILLGLVGASPDSIKSLFFYVVVYSGLTLLLFSILIFSIISVEKFPAHLAN
jgi:NADH:ubiquinone oxidoreductase subunit 2 (subunit N)